MLILKRAKTTARHVSLLRLVLEYGLLKYDPAAFTVLR